VKKFRFVYVSGLSKQHRIVVEATVGDDFAGWAEHSVQEIDGMLCASGWVPEDYTEEEVDS
jgi:hypothetical protein